MTKFLNNRVAAQLVILSREDDAGPCRPGATLHNTLGSLWIVRSLALPGMTE